MQDTPAILDLSRWSLDSGAEPRVRIGVVLACDEREAVRLRLRDERRELRGASAISRESFECRFQLHPRAELAFKLYDERVIALVDGRSLTPTPRWQIVPPPDARNSPDTGVIVPDVVAGRGFHWQKTIDVTLGGMIELFPTPSGIVLVNESPLEDYLAGVITAEMSGACPIAMLEAQAVVSRSWLLAFTERKHESDPFDRCNDDCCQRYQGIDGLSSDARRAVLQTRGVALLNQEGRVLDANYSKCCGGISETPEVVWGVRKAGLESVVDAPPEAPERRFFPIRDENLDEYLDGPWLAGARSYCGPNGVPRSALQRYLGRVDEPSEYFRWTASHARAELESLLVQKIPSLTESGELRDLRVVERGVSGRISKMDIVWRSADGRDTVTSLDSEYRIRAVLHRGFLYSSAFAVRIARDRAGRPATVTLRGAGWGHGVGMCQIGALGMALAGCDFETICRHYYPSATVRRIYI